MPQRFKSAVQRRHRQPERAICAHALNSLWRRSDGGALVEALVRRNQSVKEYAPDSSARLGCQAMLWEAALQGLDPSYQHLYHASAGRVQRAAKPVSAGARDGQQGEHQGVHAHPQRRLSIKQIINSAP